MTPPKRIVIITTFSPLNPEDVNGGHLVWVTLYSFHQALHLGLVQYGWDGSDKDTHRDIMHRADTARVDAAPSLSLGNRIGAIHSCGLEGYRLLLKSQCWFTPAPTCSAKSPQPQCQPVPGQAWLQQTGLERKTKKKKSKKIYTVI